MALFGINAIQTRINPQHTLKAVDRNFAKESCSFNYNTNRPAASTPDELKPFILNRFADNLDILA